MFIFVRLGPYIFRRNMEKTLRFREKIDGKVFVSRKSGHFFFLFNIIEVLFPICILTWRVIYVSRQGRGLNRRNERALT